MIFKNPNARKTGLAAAASLAFPISMAVCMVYGMELYNHVLMGAPLLPATLLSPLSELAPMAVSVLLVEKAVGSRVVGVALSGIGGPEGHALPAGIVRGALTCVVMCPLMSMVATLAFQHPSLETITPLWLGTFARNLPFALAWSLLVARPVSGAVAGRIGRVCGVTD